MPRPQPASGAGLAGRSPGAPPPPTAWPLSWCATERVPGMHAVREREVRMCGSGCEWRVGWQALGKRACTRSRAFGTARRPLQYSYTGDGRSNTATLHRPWTLQASYTGGGPPTTPMHPVVLPLQIHIMALSKKQIFCAECATHNVVCPTLTLFYLCLFPTTGDAIEFRELKP